MKKEDYFFTFGFGHVNNEGMNLRDHWVRVRARSFAMARKLFVEQYAQAHLPSPEQWAMQYHADHFKPRYFRSGELCAIVEQEES